MTSVQVLPYTAPTAPVEVSLNLASGLLAAHPVATAPDPLTVRFPVPAGAAGDVDGLLRELAPIAQRVLDGASVQDGYGHLGLAAENPHDELGWTIRRRAAQAA